VASQQTLGIVPVRLTVEVVMAPERLEAMLSDADRHIGDTLAERADAIVRNEKLGYYPALEYFDGHAGIETDRLEQFRHLAAQIRKRVKRDVQTCLWPVFSSVQIERAQTLAFTLPRVTPGRPDAREALARHYFPNRVRLELILSTLDKQQRLDEVERFTSQKVQRNLRDAFDSVSVTVVRRLEP
jgi:hypothetical protein